MKTFLFSSFILISSIINAQFLSTGLTYLPDGSGINYTDTIFVNGFDTSQTITLTSDFLDSLKVNIEHSYLGDLEMTLTCPNGNSVIIFNSYSGDGLAPGGFNGGNTFLGYPYDNNVGTPGNGMNYYWSSIHNTWNDFEAEHSIGNTIPVATPSLGNTMNPNGIYLPEDSFTNLTGCPLNGAWILTIRDNLGTDDGYIFNWGLFFSSGIVGNIPDANFIYSNENVVGPDTICYGDTTYFINQSNNATSFMWNFGDGDTSTIQHPIHFFQSGDYNVQLIASNSFGSDTTNHWLSIVDPLPASILGLDSILCDTTTTIIGQPSGGIFSGNGINSNYFSTYDAGNGSHTIQYYAIGNNVCYLATQTVYVTDTCFTVEIAELESSPVNIYPNPAKEQLIISLEETKSGNISIRNSLGQIVHQEMFDNTNQLNIQLNEPNGIYFLQIETDGQVVSKKIIKQ